VTWCAGEGVGSVALTGDIVQFGRPRDAQMTRPIV
jgi:hypothetical protein